jgi:hypothetical protein
MLSTHGVDGFERTKAVTATKAGRDSGRFQLGFDPSSAPSLSRFRTIQTQTLCPFARGARLWGAPAWDSSESIGGNAAEIAPVLVRFTSLLKWEVLDGFVVEVSDAALFRDLEGLAATFRTLLRELSAVDPWGSKSMDQEILAEDWQFEFNGARLFVAVFAPIYDGAHTRETYGENSAYILFQPEISFDRHLASTGRKHPAAHSQIRERFAAGGKPYDSQVITQPFEAPRYLKPLRQSDSSFEWWKDKT